MALSPTKAQKLTAAGEKLESAMKRVGDTGSTSRNMVVDGQNNIGDNNLVLNNPTIYYNSISQSGSGESASVESASEEGLHAPADKNLQFIVEHCIGEKVDLKVKVLEIKEPAGQKRSKVQFRGSFIVADESTSALLKAFGPHKMDVIGLFRPNQDICLKDVMVNPDCLNFTSYSSARKCTKSINVSAAVRSQMKRNEENDVMNPEQITMIEGYGKMKCFVKKVDPVEERSRQKTGKKRLKYSNNKFHMRPLTVKEKNDDFSKSFTLMLFGMIANDRYEEGKFYVFSKVKYSKDYNNLVTVDTCKATRCPDS